jgi:DNA-binding response OmpR family regulator
MKRILIVEDNADLAFGLRNSLEIASYEVIVASDGPSGLREARTVSPDLIILDLMLPGMDGYRVLRAVREGGSQVPVLILTARGEEADKVTGFRLGADDYVTKPFGVLELVARVEAVLRRASTTPKDGAPDPARFGEIEIQPVARVVRRNGRAVELSPKEYELLLALVQRPGQVISRAELLKTVWGYHASVVSRTIDTHIAELRRKLEPNPAAPRHITTVWKTGYRFLP